MPPENAFEQPPIIATDPELTVFTGLPEATPVDNQEDPEREVRSTTKIVDEICAPLIPKVLERDEAAEQAFYAGVIPFIIERTREFTSKARRDIGSEVIDHVLSDVLERVNSNIAKFREESKLSTWLYRVVHNSTSNQLKKQSRHSSRHAYLPMLYETSDSDAVFSSNAPGPEQVFIEKEALENFHTQLTALTPPLKEVVELRFAEGLTNIQVAEKLGITESTAKVRLHRAVQKLGAKSKALEESGYTED